MKLNYKKGFTLIELLVVIAIIGILASVVLASLSSARAKGADAKIQGQLSSMRAQAQMWADASNVAFPAGVCLTTTHTVFDTANNGLGNLLTGLLPTTPISGCISESTLPSAGGKWAVAAKLSTGAFACVDYTGASRVTTSLVLAATAVNGSAAGAIAGTGNATAAIDSAAIACTAN